MTDVRDGLNALWLECYCRDMTAALQDRHELKQDLRKAQAEVKRLLGMTKVTCPRCGAVERVGPDIPRYRCPVAGCGQWVEVKARG